MVALLVLILAFFGERFWSKKNRPAEEVYLAVTFSKIRLVHKYVI